MRGRVRDGDRRAAPPRTDWERDRSKGSKNGRRSRSRSPIKSKLMTLAMSTGRDKETKSGDKPHQENSSDRSQKRRLRMDEPERNHNTKTRRGRSPEQNRSDAGVKLKPVSSLDKVVKKAREERTNYWDKKILEAEDKDPDRWGHSGFRDLYHRKDSAKKSVTQRTRRRSRSGSVKRRLDSRRVSPNFRRRKSHSRSRSRGFSRSRSPIKRVAKSRKDLKSFSRSVSPPPIKLKTNINKASTVKSNTKTSGGHGHLGTTPKKQPLLKSSTADKGNSTKNKGIIKPRINRRSSSFSSSGSSRSRSRKYETPTKAKCSTGVKKGGKPTVSDSYSSSGSSSDEDVLQLHAKGKSRNSSLSDSRSSSSNRGRDGGIIRRASSSSTSESLSSSASDSDISIRAKPSRKIIAKKDPATPITKKNTTITKSNTISKNANNVAISPGLIVDKASINKAPSDSIKSVKSKPAMITKSENVLQSKSAEKEKNVLKKGTKSPSESGETESESGSSDSDSEPKMTLSERFGKLDKMSTDKREMAKPTLSINEIDTKMRVIKDFRTQEVPKVYVAGADSSASLQTATPIKPTSRAPPVPAFSEESRRDMPPDHHRHFERMYRDTPVEQSLDWSDAMVRFNYYKNRGCFDERPITIHEYIKWEDWYHKYREWLEQEAYYAQGGRPSQNIGTRMNGIPLGRRMDQTPMDTRGSPLPRSYLQAHDRIGRRIDRIAGGSLVVNIRPYNNARGFQTRGRNSRPQ